MPWEDGTDGKFEINTKRTPKSKLFGVRFVSLLFCVCLLDYSSIFAVIIILGIA